MNTKPLKNFAQNARRQLQDQVAVKLARVLAPDSIERRTCADAVAELEAAIARTSRDAVIEQVAYTWFNRFIALRYMDVNGYTFMGIVSPAAGFTQPELLQEAKQGLIPRELQPVLGKQKAARVLDLLSGRAASPDPQAEAYRLLLVAACNYYHKVMPFMFEEIDDYTELLMPDDLLSPHSILQGVRETLTAETCQDVEVIGWLYQFYISEKKDQIIGSKQKIKPEDIPAATQLFTPHWIVRYLVENSLGRLWLLNHPDSGLRQRMAFYIPPEEPETDFLRVDSPEELRVLDPAAGSGHMLTYAFDLLYAIYEEEGYAPADIPRLILEKNLVGLEIDQRAAALAAFALTMKARAKDRRFFRRGVAPRITVLHPVDIDMDALGAAPWLKNPATGRVDQALYNALKQDLEQLQQVNVIGSLLRPHLTLEQIDALRSRIRPRLREVGETIEAQKAAALDEAVLDALDQLARLAARYHVVVANPPYMGSGNMPEALKKYARDQYPDSKADLFAMFMERNLQFARPKGLVAMITMQSWMFLSSYEKLRQKLLDHQTILTMAHFGPRAFDTIGGEVVSTTAFVIQRAHHPEYKGVYLRLIEGDSEAEKAAMLRACISNPDCGWFYWASASDFKKIPGGPIAYWIKYFNVFDRRKVGDIFESGGRLKTHNGPKFIRYIWEIKRPDSRWKRIVKGGDFRKYYGHEEFVADWSDKAVRYYQEMGGMPPSRFLEKPGICWSKITSATTSFRIKNDYTEYDAASPTIFFKSSRIPVSFEATLTYLNSFVVRFLLGGINPTINTQVRDVLSLPFPFDEDFSQIEEMNSGARLIALSKTDWDSYETSWDFTDLPLLRPEHRRESLAATYAALRGHWREMTLEMQRLEKENNRIFIEAYGLEAELTPDVPIEEITLTCNPHYRYGGKAQVNSNQLSVISSRWPEVTDAWPEGDEGLEMRLLADAMREFISYAVGCMFGRYSLDKPGLILANQGEGVEEYVQKVTGKKLSVNSHQLSVGNEHRPGATDPLITDYRSLITFMPDANNVIPILAEPWFPDDITERFKRFLKVTFGEERYEENLAFIEAALGKDIRRYFLREFYADHVKRYKKRPIYWLFSSPKGHFNVLISMHRYRPDTLSVILNDYLREFQSKLRAEIKHLESIQNAPSATKSEKARALKRIGRLKTMLADAETYERDILFPLATQKIEIDLDDGVKVNYNKFGRALKKVAGLS